MKAHRFTEKDLSVVAPVKIKNKLRKTNPRDYKNLVNSPEADTIGQRMETYFEEDETTNISMGDLIFSGKDQAMAVEPSILFSPFQLNDLQLQTARSAVPRYMRFSSSNPFL